MRHLGVGLISGTSLDGIDAILVAVDGAGRETKVEEVAFLCLEYPTTLRDELLTMSGPGGGSVDRICALDVVVGEWFAKAALAVCESAGISPDGVDFIGSHGQTVHHMPEEMALHGVRVRATLQLGRAAVIAERTGVTTVSDFRSRDMAVGGQGAPLVPMVDFILFRSARQSRALVNIGGIGNVTLLPSNCSPEDVLAFDTGPGNMVMDALVSLFSGGSETFDRDGARAAEGQVVDALMGDLMEDSFLALPPPKSTGRERYGGEYVSALLAKYGHLAENDLLRTLTSFTARSIVQAIHAYGNAKRSVTEVFVSGGGALNPTLMSDLGSAAPDYRVGTITELGVKVESKEALAFAVLANETLAGNPGNLPFATGARAPVVLGSVTPGRAGFFPVD